MKTASLIFLLVTVMALERRLNAETGYLNFNNLVGDTVDAPVSRPDGSGAGAGVTAQLFRVNANGGLAPLLPTTTFRTFPVAGRFYIFSTLVTLDSVEPFEAVALRMRAWEGKDWASASLRGESKDFLVTFGGEPSLQPPMYLSDLEGFELEPTSVSVILGSPRVDGKNFVFDIRSTPGTRVVIQSSTDLKNWQTVSVQTLAGGLAQVADTIGDVYRFYRAIAE